MEFGNTLIYIGRGESEGVKDPRFERKTRRRRDQVVHLDPLDTFRPVVP